MNASAIVLLAAFSLGAANVCEEIPSYLYQPCYSLKDAPGPAVAYLPQPGDVLLATDKNWFWSLTHDLAFAFEPHNSAVIVAREDGSLAVLEAGADETVWGRRGGSVARPK